MLGSRACVNKENKGRRREGEGEGRKIIKGAVIPGFFYSPCIQHPRRKELGG
jgi:hypothetical protein